ncbi:spore coat protein [Desulfolucanica intricata]|uniref:spore coat protein n=1 Tax=Desulfolucanica intricata TaxID=1285191 RepID=UPI00082B3329|nr:spore coat protein [Desulfolucanica intricata]
MASLINALMGGGDEKQLNNAIIANDMLAGSKAAAAAYLTASLEAATPEIKNLFFNHVTQATQGHQAITELALKKGWYKPYQSPDEQLKETFTYSQTFTQQNA